MIPVTRASSYLGKQVTVFIDRPMHSQHPKYDWAYPLNYGYVPGTLSPDGEELDAYVLGVTEPMQTFTGICIAVIHRLNDQDDKLVVVPEEKSGITNKEIQEATFFQEQYFQSEIFRAE